MRIHREWLDLLDDPETTRFEKIQLLRDAARTCGLFKDQLLIRDYRAPDWDPEKGDPKDYVQQQIGREHHLNGK